MTAPEVLRLELPNGLLVLLKEIHTAPIISHWVWYRVGSKDESTGQTGISHWTEHMQFKGTPRFKAGVLDRAIARDGGSWNAMTYLDWTTYYETMPADKIELAIALEADRMVNSLFDPQEVESERSVIIAERQGNENEPTFRLHEEVQAAAFRVHPYHHDVIGDMADLESIQRDNLYQHYRTYYAPNNAVLSVAGDFDCEVMLEHLTQTWAHIPAGPALKRIHRPEPPQAGERMVTVEGPGETCFVDLVFHTPAANQADFLVCTVLDSLLTGASSLNFFGSGISNKTSRLYRALVEQEVAVGVFGGLPATQDPYLYAINLTMHPNRKPEEALKVIEQEIDKLQQNPPPEDEVRRAVKQAKALFAYGSESITNQAYWLGFSEMFAEYEWFTSYLERLAQVTAQDIQRAAQTYLRRQNRVVGIYHPNGSNPGGLE